MILKKNCFILFFKKIFFIILKNSNIENIPTIIKKKVITYLSIIINDNKSNKTIEV